MIEKEDQLITKDDYLILYVIGYRNQGESIILSIGDKFLGVIDCFKVRDKFETKRIIKELGIPIDFICWTHVDWDHTYGLSELKEFMNENTSIIVPEGLGSKEIRNLFYDPTHYQHKEYCSIYNIIDDTEKFISANDNTEIYNFKFKYQGDEIDFIMKSFAPMSKIVRDLNKKDIKNLVKSVGIDKKLGYNWYEESNKLNNLFSVGLEITIKLKSEDIRICLTGDLDNETIEKMDPIKVNRIFSRNTVLKIPHHGSHNAGRLIDYNYKNRIAYKYAISTSFKQGNIILPREDIIDKYKKNGKVYRTDFKDKDQYGIVIYKYPLISKIESDDYKEIETLADADEA
ncbi:hypothetical protein [Clostridium tagluense]|uniref:hypothetical protein n=1 Tax=Clostridium tagluense TaxID=360422 RepID=UPI001C0BC6B1|nr:hypothetical protein [Clostridium tagluense]MBU3126228.1 hypothetical protein [Clostridium tagluense]